MWLPTSTSSSRRLDPRRIYESHTAGADWYAFLARTPDEIATLIATGFTELAEPEPDGPDETDGI